MVLLKNQLIVYFFHHKTTHKMKLYVLLIVFLSCLMTTNFCQAANTEEKVIEIEEKTPPPDNKNKPRMPAKRNVEAWLEGSVMTIIFTTSEGDASLSLETSDGFISEEMVYSTEAPIVIDLTPYGDVVGFTLSTVAGNTYIGYIY